MKLSSHDNTNAARQLQKYADHRCVQNISALFLKAWRSSLWNSLSIYVYIFFLLPIFFFEIPKNLRKDLQSDLKHRTVSSFFFKFALFGSCSGCQISSSQLAFQLKHHTIKCFKTGPKSSYSETNSPYFDIQSFVCW